jgi:hypothetical protein
MSTSLVQLSRLCPEPGCHRKLSASGNCFTHGKVAETAQLTLTSHSESTILADLATQADMIEVRRKPGRPRGTGKSQLNFEKWCKFLNRAVEFLSARSGRLVGIACRNLKVPLEHDRTPGPAETPGIIPTLPSTEIAAVFYCMMTAVRTAGSREAGYDSDRLPSLAWARAWLSLLEETRCLASAVAADCGLDEVCGTALIMGYLVCDRNDYGVLG